MGKLVDVFLPDIGDYKDVPVVEINVKVGDVVSIDGPLLTIESDKATMEVPSPSAGIVKELKVEVGSRVSRGAALAIIDKRTAGNGRSLDASEKLPPTSRPEGPVAELA